MTRETRSGTTGPKIAALLLMVAGIVRTADAQEAQAVSATPAGAAPERLSSEMLALEGQGAKQDEHAAARRYFAAFAPPETPTSPGAASTAPAPPGSAPVAASPDRDAPLGGSARRSATMPTSVVPDTPESAAPAATGADDSLDGALRDVVNSNPDILEALARRDEARFVRGQSLGALLPTVDYTTSTGTERSRPGAARYVNEDRFERQAVVRQLLFDFGQSAYDIRRASRLLESADWSVRAAVDAIGLEVASAYLGVVEKQQLLELARENLAAHERILLTVKSQREFGLSSGADVSRVEARLNAAKAAVLDRDSDLAQAREAYRRQLNRLPGRLAPPPLAEPLLPVDEPGAVRLALQSNPDVRRATAEVAALRSQRAAQLATYMPRIELEAQQNYRKNAGGGTGTIRDERAMIVVRYKAFDGGVRENAYGRIGARLRAAYSAEDRARRDVEQQVRIEFAALAAAREKVAAIDAEVEAGRRLVELYTEQFRTGGRSVFDLLDGQETLIQAKGKRISNVTAREVSAYRVLASMGRLFETVTGAPYPVKENQRWWGARVEPIVGPEDETSGRPQN